MADLGGDLEFGTKKKSKKKKDLADGGTEGAGNGGDGLAATGQPWDGRDYKYDELLGRVFRILNEHNPELGGQATKTILKPPQVLREGTKKTVFANFSDLCKLYVLMFPSPTPFVEAGCLRGSPPAPAVPVRVIHTPLIPPWLIACSDVRASYHGPLPRLYLTLPHLPHPGTGFPVCTGRRTTCCST